MCYTEDCNFTGYLIFTVVREKRQCFGHVSDFVHTGKFTVSKD